MARHLVFAAALLTLVCWGGCGGGGGTTAAAPQAERVVERPSSDLGPSHRYDTGKTPALAVNDDGTVLTVHKSAEADVLYASVGNLVGCACTLSAAAPASEDGTEAAASGQEPAVALNNRGIAVTIYEVAPGPELWYRLGNVDPVGPTVTWGPAYALLGGDDTSPRGRSPCVAINDDGTAVEVHAGADEDLLWYRMGIVQPLGDRIDWGPASPLFADGDADAAGVTPTVAINERDLVVALHKAPTSDALYYRVGTLRPEASEIGWGRSRTVCPDPGACLPATHPTVAVHGDGLVVEMHTSPVDGGLWYREGLVHQAEARIDWHEEDPRGVGPGLHPSIDVADGNTVIAIHESDTEGNLHMTASAVQDRANWMRDNMDILGDLTLSQIVIPGSHDAVMYRKCHPGGCDCTTFANDCSTRTQRLDIEAQLRAGSRYFDLRPIVKESDWKDGGRRVRTGHFSKTVGWWKFQLGAEGCYGVDLRDVLAQVRAFLATHEEVVILKLSHGMYIPNGILAHGTDLHEDHRDEVCKVVKESLHSVLYRGRVGQRLAYTPLSDILSDGGRAIVVVDGDTRPANFSETYEPLLHTYKDVPHHCRTCPDCADCRTAEVLQGGDLAVYDDYTGTDSFGEMKDDQLKKMWAPGSHNGDLFLLSWTRTETGGQSADCVAEPGTCRILEMADYANAHLWTSLREHLDHVTLGTMPNVIFHDAVAGQGTDVAVFLNRRLHPKPFLLGMKEAEDLGLSGADAFDIYGQFDFVPRRVGAERIRVDFFAFCVPTGADPSDPDTVAQPYALAAVAFGAEGVGVAVSPHETHTDHSGRAHLDVWMTEPDQTAGRVTFTMTIHEAPDTLRSAPFVASTTLTSGY